MSYTVKKISSKNPEEPDKSLFFYFRPVNALDLQNFLKIDLLKIP